MTFINNTFDTVDDEELAVALALKSGFTISPEMQAEMDAQGMASSAKTLSSAFVTTVAAAALAFA